MTTIEGIHKRAQLPPPGAAESLLVVDDEELNLDMLSRRLRRSGFTVEVASSGPKALQMVREQAFDLVLLDQMMPGMSGAEVLRAVRADPSSEGLPVIMVTAVAESERIAEALEMGANDYITKPVDFKVALARIKVQLARHRAEAALRQSEERYALAARASQDGLWDWNMATGKMYYSPRWREILGLTGADIGDDTEAALSRIVPADRQRVVDELQTFLGSGEDVLPLSFRMRHADGSVRWMSSRGVATRGPLGQVVRMSGSQLDVTEEKTRDVLTGLPNRLLLISQLELALETVAGHPGAGPVYAVLFLDLDGFKTINDSLGHQAGDELLRLIAGRLRLASAQAHMGHADLPRPLAARMGGDEFAILIERGASRPSVEVFAGQVQQLMKQSFDLDGHPVHCAFSIGVALAHPTHRTAEDVLREADMAMYVAKFQRHGEVVIFDPSMRDLALQRLELETDIRSAAAGGQLLLLYQPKVDMATGTTYGVEALVRWNHPTRGLLQPNVFIPVAEETGAIVDIGKWVLREACLQVGRWHKQFVLGPLLELSVNLSPREFKQKDLVEQIGRTIKETGYPATSLHLELTENVLFEDMTAARATLLALKRLGVRLDIDDFGSGYSSLKYLRELPFDALKIDRYFTSGLDANNPSSEKLVQAILHMGRNLGLQVIAEGIETEAHSVILRRLGCRFGQGYYYSRPLSSEDLQRRLTVERLKADAAAGTQGQTARSLS